MIPNYSFDFFGFVAVLSCSTITTWTKNGEREAFKNMLTQFPEGLVAVVSDSYDVYNACEQFWGRDLKELVS